jgi:hypothetical protein
MLMKNKEQFETELFLDNQVKLGFKPKWFITYHYKHPSENVRAILKQTMLLDFKLVLGLKPMVICGTKFLHTIIWKEKEIPMIV